jgi:hypothetical protein
VPNRKPGFGTPAALCEPTVAISSTTWPTADGGIITNLISVIEAANAAEVLDARVIAAARVSVVLRPMPVVGVGYGVLPRLVGEAHSMVGFAGAGAATLSFSGAAIGEHDDFDDLTLMLLMLAA